MNFRARANGFWITFPSGVVLSTQFSFGNYCMDYPSDKIWDTENYNKERDDIKNVEVAVGIDNFPCELTKEMNRAVFGEPLDDDVKGFVDINDWLKIFEWCKNYKPTEQGIK